MTAGHWETVHCPNCPSGVHPVAYLNCRDRFDGPGSVDYSLVRCSGCGLIYLSPRPSDLAPFYTSDGYDPFLTLSTPKTLTERLYARARKWTLDWKLHLVQQLVPNSGSILDLGCGTGEFLSALMPFYTVEGIEPEARAAQFAAQHFGMNVHAGTLTDIAVTSAPFDLITLWHVLEHIPDPVEAVRKLQTLLNPRGKLLIALPNVGSLDARWYGADWVALDAPRHLWHFTPQTLKSLLEGNGFHPVIQKMLPLDTFYNSLMSEGLILRRGGRLQYVALPFRAALYVTASLLNGALTGSHSGMVYIFESRK